MSANVRCLQSEVHTCIIIIKLQGYRQTLQKNIAHAVISLSLFLHYNSLV